MTLAPYRPALFPRLRLRACKLCSGDLILDEAEDSLSYFCLQCGRQYAASATTSGAVSSLGIALPVCGAEGGQD